MTSVSINQKKLPDDRPNAALDEERLEREFEIFAKYLVGEEPPEDFFERYVQACQNTLWDCPPSPFIKQVLKKPWLLGPLDAALGLVKPRDEIRKKLLIATAILEASPNYTEHFLSQQQGIILLCLKMSWVGLTSGFKLLIGLVLLLLLKEDFSFDESDRA